MCRKYSPTLWMRKVKSRGPCDLPKTSEPVTVAEFECRSANNMALPFTNGRTTLPWQTGTHWNEDSTSDNCKVISGRNEDKLELNSFNYTFTSDLSLRKN